MPYCPILATLGYVLSPDKSKVLLNHRISKNTDEHLGKYNGLGGKLERKENLLQGLYREIHEESGIHCIESELRGSINWTNFGPSQRDWMCFIYLITKYDGIPWGKNAEGPLEWIPINKLTELPMWEGDYLFIPLLFDNDPKPFHGWMDYDGDKVSQWSYTR